MPEPEPEPPAEEPTERDDPEEAPAVPMAYAMPIAVPIAMAVAVPRVAMYPTYPSPYYRVPGANLPMGHQILAGLMWALQEEYLFGKGAILRQWWGGLDKSQLFFAGTSADSRTPSSSGSCRSSSRCAAAGSRWSWRSASSGASEPRPRRIPVSTEARDA